MPVICNYASDNEYKLGACRGSSSSSSSEYATSGSETTTGGGSNMEIKIENKTAAFCGKLWQEWSLSLRVGQSHACNNCNHLLQGVISH